MRVRASHVLLAALLAFAGQGAGAQRSGAQRGGDSTATDSARRGRGGIIPAGFGTLRLDDVSVVVQLNGLTVKALPLDESVIRALAPDTYRNRHALAESKAKAIEAIRARLGLPTAQAWHVIYFNEQQGEARYDPHDVLIRSAGRDFRPLDVLGVSTGFDQGRLAQSRQADAIYVFDPAIDLTQPLTVTIGGRASSAWGDIASRLDAERTAVWSRAAARRP